jgi:tRNA(adenine34) deaminase
MKHMKRAIELALEAESNGNLPVGAVLVLDDEVIAEGASAIVTPQFHPGRHAETEALARVDITLWTRAREMTCYTTLEPCVMCFGALLLHGVGTVVFGARDPQGGASAILRSLPLYYADGTRVPEWHGPALPEECDPLYARAKLAFDKFSKCREKRRKPRNIRKEDGKIRKRN